MDEPTKQELELATRLDRGIKHAVDRAIGDSLKAEMIEGNFSVKQIQERAMQRPCDKGNPDEDEQ